MFNATCRIRSSELYSELAAKHAAALAGLQEYSRVHVYRTGTKFKYFVSYDRQQVRPYRPGYARTDINYYNPY